MNRFGKVRIQGGSTMIEVLVAILIFSIGLLGVATTQTMGLTTTQSAMHRSYAAQLTYELIDIVRMNPTAEEDGDFNPVNVDSTNGSSAYSSTAACTSESSFSTSSSGCSTTQMANTQLSQWEARLANLLPDSTAALSLNSGTGVYTLTISWPDFKNNLNRPDADSDGEIDDATLVTDFRI